MSKKRESNFEVLRILSMFLIVLSHFAVHGTYQVPNYPTTMGLIVDLLSFGGKLGSNLFVVIGAYFLVGKSFELRRVSQLVVETWVYSLVILGVFTLIPGYEITSRRFFQSILPFPDTYWFVTSYIFLLCVSGILNYLILNLSQKSYQYLLVFLGICWSVLPTMQQSTIGLDNNTWFIFLYLCVGYIKLYVPRNYTHHRFWVKSAIVSIVLTWLWIVLHYVLGNHVASYYQAATVQIAYYGVLTVTTTLCLFMVGYTYKSYYSEVINKIARYMFGVYLIHEHPIMRDVIWGMVNNKQYTSHLMMGIMGILVSVVIFLGMIFLAAISDYLLKSIIQKTSEYLTNGILNLIGQFERLKSTE